MGKKYNPKIHKRRSIRLPLFDYAEPCDYFITICTKDKKCLFGSIRNNKIELYQCGYIVKNNIQNIMHRYDHVRIASYIIMPNHLHAVIQIKTNQDAVGAQFIAPQEFAQRGVMNHAPTVGMIVRAFKARCTHDIHSFAPDATVWQRNYYERIIRSDDELFDTIEYIKNNPNNWAKDPMNKH
jgi:REP element-mobilizing transposase RayT